MAKSTRSSTLQPTTSGDCTNNCTNNWTTQQKHQQRRQYTENKSNNNTKAHMAKSHLDWHELISYWGSIMPLCMLMGATILDYLCCLGWLVNIATAAKCIMHLYNYFKKRSQVCCHVLDISHSLSYIVIAQGLGCSEDTILHKSLATCAISYKKIIYPTWLVLCFYCKHICTCVCLQSTLHTIVGTNSTRSGGL